MDRYRSNPRAGRSTTTSSRSTARTTAARSTCTSPSRRSTTTRFTTTRLATRGRGLLRRTGHAGDVAEFVNNLVTSNQATGPAGGGGIYVEPLTNPIVRFSDLWGNTPTNVAGSKTDASYIGLNGVISVDPLYVNRNAVPPDFHLLDGKPGGRGRRQHGRLGPPDGLRRLAAHPGQGRQRRRHGGHGGVRVLARLRRRRHSRFGRTRTTTTTAWSNASDCAPLNRAISQAPDRVGEHAASSTSRERRRR